MNTQRSELQSCVRTLEYDISDKAEQAIHQRLHQYELQHQQRMTTAESTLTRYELETQLLRTEIASVNSEARAEQSRIMLNSKNAISTSDQQIAQLKQELSTARSTIQQNESTIEKLQWDLRLKSVADNKSLNDNQSLTNQLATMTTELQEAKASRDDLNQQLEETQ